jgi:acetyltransferase-like isoleucine patch superfamily enzyme
MIRGLLHVLINLILSRARGKSISSFGGIAQHQALLYLFRKGGVSVLRGLMIRPFLGSSQGMIFIGRGVNIVMASKLSLGKNFYIGDYSYLNCYSKLGVRIGNNVTIREFAWLQLTSRLDNPGESIVIGDDTYIGPRVNLGAAAPVEIGSRCQIGANVSFIAENHVFEEGEEIYQQSVTRKGIKVGDDCWIGNGVIILDGVCVGSGVVIGAGSVVTRDIPSNSVAFGVPAHVNRKR